MAKSKKISQEIKKDVVEDVVEDVVVKETQYIEVYGHKLKVDKVLMDGYYLCEDGCTYKI